MTGARFPELTRAGALALGLAICAPTALTAQQLRGTIIRPDSVTPASRVLIEWSSGAAAGRLATDDGGRFTVRLALPDTLRLRVLRPGFRPESLPTQVLGRGATETLRHILRGEAVALSAMRIEEDRVCGSRGEAVAWQLWEQARTVLLSTQISERDTSLRVEAIAYIGDVFEGTLDVRDESVRRVALEAPHPAAYYDSLFRLGFIRRQRDTTTYHAPTLPVIADARFAERYCFRRVSDGSAHPDAVGVEFSPQRAPGPGIADITGVFWLDRADLTLREVTYTYLNAPLHHRIDGLGGELRFAPLESGDWILQAWQIRMPTIATWSRVDRSAVALWAEGRTVARVRRGTAVLYEDAEAEAMFRRPWGGGR